MSEEKVLEARNKAGGYFKEGYNCAESIFHAFKDELELDENMVKILTGFGGGIGHAGCTCGALVGSIGVIGCLKGRTDNDNEIRIDCYDHTKEFHDIFKHEFKTTCCRVLNKGDDFESRAHNINCLKITGKTGQLLMEFLLEKGLITT
jgi:C_GCAxxG_C_C family probable redox protein